MLNTSVQISPVVAGSCNSHSDDDGMPDAWEAAHGFDKTDGADYNKVMPSGYTAIEEYINERAQQLIEWAE